MLTSRSLASTSSGPASSAAMSSRAHVSAAVRSPAASTPASSSLARATAMTPRPTGPVRIAIAQQSAIERTAIPATDAATVSSSIDEPSALLASPRNRCHSSLRRCSVTSW